MLIDLVQLRTFVAVAEEQHLTRAAERLYMSQSAASAHVRAIEERLGTQLFVRTNRSLELTQAGQLVARKAKTLLKEEALFTSFARELKGKIEGKLVVGTSSEPGTRIGEMLASLRAKHPLVNVDVMARTSDRHPPGAHEWRARCGRTPRPPGRTKLHLLRIDDRAVQGRGP